ncbi:MAG: glycosyltransferase family 2 protein [Candidatus Delongbacteria bacterium]|nr:glycosyltransferase family 2 protein [Candidatus Cloacimonadota bacterium]MCB9474087.1 glycosyltransferase family 2 protein [Candidatus Delongbacteria bacterium]
MEPTRLSVVIPAWNEERRIVPSLERALPVLARLVPRHEIVVVDDGSADRTLDVAREVCARFDAPFAGFSLEHNRGKGGAVKAGMLAARGEFVLFCDADQSTPMTALEGFLPGMAHNAPVLIGTRKSREARIERHQPWLRESMGKAFTGLARALIGVQVTDFTCGFKIFRRDAAREIFGRQTVNDWSFDAEILFLARALDYPIQEVPVTWTNDTDTKVRLLRDSINSFAGLLRIRRQQRAGLYHLPSESGKSGDASQ